MGGGVRDNNYFMDMTIIVDFLDFAVVDGVDGPFF